MYLRRQIAVPILLILATTTGTARPKELTGILTQVVGGVQLAGPGVEATPLASPWQVVRAGVTIRVPEGASAGITCSNNRFVFLGGPATWLLSEQTCAAGKKLTPAEYALVAPQAGRFKVVAGILVLEREIRSGYDHFLDPVVLSPRNTRLRSQRPTVSWLQVPAVTEYRVEWTGRKSGRQENIVKRTDIACAGEREQSNFCILPWPDGRPQLPPNGTFFLRVSARNGIVGPWHGSDSLEVHTLSTSDARELDEALRDLAGLHLSGAALETAQAGILAKHQIYSDAIESFTRALTAVPTSELRVTLGDLYLIVGLLQLAEVHYRGALENGSRAARAAATFGLGRIQYARGQYGAAAGSFHAARELYAPIDRSEEEIAACYAAEKAATHLSVIR